ncbi:MAG: tripartite tricarboxylate transporter substrate binding protein [Spirochaetales bacterium]|jgi:tripartite-type tricarboxylate transporter receptor subunit TctC|nr:tripartite tricarboxylate transporter substrate binding protein [Spirochaetales bacterium]
MKKLAFLFLIVCLVLIPVSVFAGGGADSAPAGFPTKTIRVLVPYGAGGNSDLNARIIADIATQQKFIPGGQSMIVTNLEGAATMNAIQALLDADPDGHTIMLHQSSITAQYNLGNIKYNYTDFTPIAQVFESPLMHSARADNPFNTLEEAVQYATANPGKVRWAHTGVGQSSYIACEVLWSNYHGRDIHDIFKILAYTGGADSAPAQLGGDIDIRTGSALDTMSYVDAGQIKLLALSGNERLSITPDTPSYKDLGLDDRYNIHQGFFCRKEVPAETVRILQEIIFKAVDHPRYKEFCDKNGGFLRRRNGDEFAETLKAVDAAVAEVVAKIKTR